MRRPSEAVLRGTSLLAGLLRSAAAARGGLVALGEPHAPRRRAEERSP